MDITKWLKNEVLEDYVGHPITLDLHINNLSDKYEVGLLLTITVIPKTKKEDK